VQLFRQYSDKYDVDFLLMAAQGYQESRLDHAARSPVGAIGIMQVMPATGAELKVGTSGSWRPISTAASSTCGQCWMRTSRTSRWIG
jgi:soluble lytic murein transglycosylase-like protein